MLVFVVKIVGNTSATASSRRSAALFCWAISPGALIHLTSSIIGERFTVSNPGKVR
jgi:hypothetical protein